ncbi:MAG: GNAT family N-acetyltransferase [Cyclobacteriaceae bacterium]
MLDQLIISKAQESDLMTILQLQCLAYHSEAKLYNDFSIPPLRQTLTELIEEASKSTILKATYDQQLVGSVRGIMEGDTGKIGRLIVDPKFQGHGIGSMLLERIEECFSNAKRFELFTGARSMRNLGLYKRRGYRECKRDLLTDHVSVVFLEKRRVIYPTNVNK